MTAEAGRLPTEWVAAPAAVITAFAALVLLAGVVAAARTPARGGETFATHTVLALELLLAAGLLRLAAVVSVESLATVAAIVAIRRVIGLGIRTGAAASGR